MLFEIRINSYFVLYSYYIKLLIQVFKKLHNLFEIN